MPELPEVEAARVLARRVALGRRITRVWCAGDPIVFEARRPAQVRRFAILPHATACGAVRLGLGGIHLLTLLAAAVPAAMAVPDELVGNVATIQANRAQHTPIASVDGDA